MCQPFVNNLARPHRRRATGLAGRMPYLWLEFGLAQAINYPLALERIKPQLEVFDDDQFGLPF